MLNRFREGTRSAPSLLLEHFHSLFNRPGERIPRRAPQLQDNEPEERKGDETVGRNDPITPLCLGGNTEYLASSLEDQLPRPSSAQRPLAGMATQSHEWNIPIPPDIMYHIIDTYLTPSTILTLCAALPVLQPYCYPQTFGHISVGIGVEGSRSKKLLVRVELSISALDRFTPIVITTSDDFGYPDGKKAHGVMFLATNLALDITSMHLHFDLAPKWCQLDKYMKAFITALLRRSSLCSVSLRGSDIPVNLLGVVQNLKILDVNSSLGPPEEASFSTGVGKVCLEKIILRSGLEHWLVGPGSPIDWSRLRVIEYYKYWNRALIIQELLVLCSASLHRLDIALHDGNDGGLVDLSVLTHLRHITLSISLTEIYEQTLYEEGGMYSSLVPFKWVPIILGSCNGHNTIETIFLRFGVVNPEDLRRCDWLSVDKIFERRGTWKSLKEVLVVIIHNSDGTLDTSHTLEPNRLEWAKPSTTPCLQARKVISWRKYNRGSINW